MRRLAALALALAALPAAHAELSVTMGQPVFGHCERLLYTISVPEVTGEPAVIHIRDSANRSGSAVPVPILGPETQVPSPFPLEDPPFAPGTYHVDVRYGGEQATAPFEVRDRGLVCLPATARAVAHEWARGAISDGFMVDALQRYVEEAEIPFEIDESNVYLVDLPGWAASVGRLWAAGGITDAELIGVVNYLAAEGLLIPARPDPGA